MISVIIPTHNRSSAISSVVRFARCNPHVGEVIVVDDSSTDGTAQAARAAGAFVITSPMPGKGIAMAEGLKAARNKVVLYLDDDLPCPHQDLIDRMADPIVEGKADFVKANFARSSARISALMGLPLLQILFPELSHRQTLGGTIAARRSLLQKVRFEDDYAVDMGLFLDVAKTGARLAEIDVGGTEHDSQPLEVLSSMAMQVARVILDRAARHGRVCFDRVQQAEATQPHITSGHSIRQQQADRRERLAIFDLDGTLIQGRFVVSLAEQINKSTKLARLLNSRTRTAAERILRIASLFRGVPQTVFEQVARDMTLTPGAAETVASLRKAGFRVGIVTDGFCAVAETVRHRVSADFCIAHALEFRRGTASGQVILSKAMAHPQGCPHHIHCKVNVLHTLRDLIGIQANQILAIGDGDDDICLLRAAGTAIAFEPKTESLQAAAGQAVFGDLTGVLAAIEEKTDHCSKTFEQQSLRLDQMQRQSGIALDVWLPLPTC